MEGPQECGPHFLDLFWWLRPAGLFFFALRDDLCASDSYVGVAGRQWPRRAIHRGKLE